MSLPQKILTSVYGFLFWGCAMSGLIADSRTMVDKARVEAQVKPEYPHTNSQDWSPYISLNN